MWLMQTRGTTKFEISHTDCAADILVKVSAAQSSNSMACRNQLICDDATVALFRQARLYSFTAVGRAGWHYPSTALQLLFSSANIPVYKFKMIVNHPFWLARFHFKSAHKFKCGTNFGNHYSRFKVGGLRRCIDQLPFGRAKSYATISPHLAPSSGLLTDE